MEENQFAKKLKQYGYKENIEKGSFLKGLMWAMIFSIPLWLSIFGWIKMIHSFFA